MAKIAIDMDGVLADFVGSAIKAVKEEWGIDLSYDEIKEFRFANTVKRKQREMGLEVLSNQKIYNRIMRDGTFENLKPMPGAVEVVHELVEKGHEITILTKALSIHRWDEKRRKTVDSTISEKLNWLWNHFKKIPYNVIMVSDMEAKLLVNTHIIVDDDPRALEHPTAISICVAHPWNEEFRRQQKDMQQSISSMFELPDVVELAESTLQTMEELEGDAIAETEKALGIERL